jgi:hypothetical protein
LEVRKARIHVLQIDLNTWWRLRHSQHTVRLATCTCTAPFRDRPALGMSTGRDDGVRIRLR